MRVSVVIDNYDNARLLSAAVDSALAQTHPDVEVVVVDDGSPDGSVTVMRGYGNRIVPVHQANAGQAAALNAGIARATGEAVILLDSDDVLAPTAAATAAAMLTDPAVARVQWPMTVIDANGHPTGGRVCEDLEAGDLADRVLADGPFGYGWSSTSGNAWSRQVLDRVLPIPEGPFRLCPDIYLSTIVPLYGRTRVVASQSSWRTHEHNRSRPMRRFDERLQTGVERFEACLAALQVHAAAQGLALDVDMWRSRAWFLRLQRAVDVVDRLVPAGQALLVIDDDAWELEGTVRGRHAWPFLEHDGRYHGPPADDTHARQELARMRAMGVDHVVVAWTSTWWLDAYPHLASLLEEQAVEQVATDDVRIYALGPRRPGS